MKTAEGVYAYKIGQRYLWVPHYTYEPAVPVMVVGMRKRGSAMLSNGWVVDEFGVAEGTERMRGGRIEEMSA